LARDITETRVTALVEQERSAMRTARDVRSSVRA